MIGRNRVGSNASYNQQQLNALASSVAKRKKELSQTILRLAAADRDVPAHVVVSQFSARFAQLKQDFDVLNSAHVVNGGYTKEDAISEINRQRR